MLVVVIILIMHVMPCRAVPCHVVRRRVVSVLCRRVVSVLSCYVVPTIL